MKNTKEPKGITLIALTIVIVLLIISGAGAILLIKNTETIEQAKNVGGLIDNEDDTFSNGETQSENIGGWIDNGDGTFSKGETKVAIGDYVNYIYDDANEYSLTMANSGYNKNNQSIIQMKELKWKVLGINTKGELELISDTPVKEVLYFGRATGYNNAVFLLNDICKSQYSNNNLGITARSINIEDIEKQYSDEGIKARTTYERYGNKYGETKTYGTGKNSYPTLYEKEALSGNKNGITASDPFYTNKKSLSLEFDENGNFLSTSRIIPSNELKLTQTFYGLYKVSDFHFKNKEFYDMIYNTGTVYWIASRYVGNSELESAEFGVYFVAGNIMNGCSFYDSKGSTRMYASYIRPVVTISANVSVITNNDNNSTTNMWTLK